jgi:hypothetical protein
MSIAVALSEFVRFHARLFRLVATIATPTFDFAGDRAAPTAQHLGNLRDCLLGVRKAVDLVSFLLT